MYRRILSPLILAAVVVPLAVLGAPPEPADPPEKATPRVSVGIAVQEMPNEGPHGGVLIRNVRPDGPAAKAGLKKGDIIVRVSNRQVDDFDELVNVLAGHAKGDQLTFQVLRQGEPEKVKVTLGGPPTGDASPPEGCRTCAFLGVLTVPAHALTDETVERFGLTSDEGLIVLDVVPGSAAAEAGLRHGDQIKRVNGEAISNPDSLRHLVHKAGVGSEVSLQVQRGEITKDMKVKLTHGPCDVHLFVPREAPSVGGEAGRVIERLRGRIDALEKRIKELEGKREPPAK